MPLCVYGKFVQPTWLERVSASLSALCPLGVWPVRRVRVPGVPGSVPSCGSPLIWSGSWELKAKSVRGHKLREFVTNFCVRKSFLSVM